MKLTFRLQVLGGFLTVLVALGGLMYLAVQSNSSYLENTRQIILFNQALYHIEQVRSWSMEMETSQRGFTITYDSAFLQPYIKSAAMAEDNIRELRLLTGSLVDYDQISQLPRLVKRKKDSTHRIILARHHGFDSARQVISSYAGKQITDSIRLIADGAEAQIKSALFDMRLKREGEMQNSQMQVAVTIILTTVVLTVLFLLIDYNQQKRLKAEKDLGEALREKDNLYQQAPCGYFSVDKDLRFVKVNDTFLNLAGYTRDEILTKMNLDQIMTPASAEVLVNTRRDRPVEEVHTLDLDLVRADGRTFGVTASLQEFNHDTPEIRFSVIDCSEKRKAEKVCYVKGYF